jgi:hypothetical protein
MGFYVGLFLSLSCIVYVGMFILTYPSARDSRLEESFEREAKKEV